ncbi:MAG: Unknown protein, partial [uncultured Sulfurovum sp.]
MILISTLLASSLLADTSLGQRLSVSSAQEKIVQEPLRTRINPNQQPVQQVHVPQEQRSSHLTTRVSPQAVQRSFKADHHRYDKRYSTFDYDRHSYYNNDGYYYGYYDTTGYFFNNIFFSYNRNYSYND